MAAAQQRAEEAGLVQALRRVVDLAGEAAPAAHAYSQNVSRYSSLIHTLLILTLKR